MATTAHAEDEGATPTEQLLEAARRNNLELLEEVLAKHNHPEFLNSSKDALGNTALHLAAQYGSYEVVDELLDQNGLDVDLPNTLEADTPLHKAVMLVKTERQLGLEVVDLLVDAGADPRIRNKQKQKPIDICDPHDTELRQILNRAEYVMTAGNDLVVTEDDNGPTGSGSDSD